MLPFTRGLSATYSKLRVILTNSINVIETLPVNILILDTLDVQDRKGRIGHVIGSNRKRQFLANFLQNRLSGQRLICKSVMECICITLLI